MSQQGPPPEERIPFLSRAVLVRRSELPGLVGGFLYFFCLLCSYYMLRPVRDEMGVRGGVENLQWLFTATFLVMLAAVPAFAALAARFPRRRLIPAVYGFFIACIIGFWVWLESGLAGPWAARAFFVWLSVFNLFVVSVFWSFMADIFDHRQAARLFGAVAAGGSAGAILGPAVTTALATEVGPAAMLPLAASVLALTVPCMLGLGRWSDRRRDHGLRAARGGEPLGGNILEGVRAVLGSRYLVGICAFIWLYTTLSTFLYFTQAEIVKAAFAESGERTSVFAAIDLATNTLTVGIQLFVTGRLVQRIGLARTLALVPALVAVGFLVLAAAPALLAIALVQVVRRAGNYALARPGREMLFTVISRMEKYKAKNFIDTVVYRGGDAVAGWAFAGLAAAGFGLRGTALVAVPLALVWLVVGYWLGRGHQERARALPEEVRDARSPLPETL
jgi:AAA family ATP:ADP antiporter